MNIDPWILAFSALTVGATLWMGFRSARTSKTASDFFVAGRNVSVGWNASAISGEYLSAASFMGVAGMVMSSGYDALWYPVCYACGYLFLLLFIAGPLRRFGAYTIPDFAEGRFDSPVFRKIAVVFVLFIGFFYTMPQMKGAGTTLAYIFPGLPYWVGVVLVGAVITLNVSLGGMKGITLVQAFQYWAKMFAISVPIFVLMAVYGHYGKQVGMNGVRAVQKLPFTTAAELINALSNSPTSQTPLFIRAENALTMDDAVKNVGAAKNYAKKVLRVDQYRFSTNLPMLVELREAYAFLTRKTVFYYSDKRDEGRVPFDSSPYVTSATTASVIEEIFRTNGTSIFHLNNTQAVFLAGKHLEQVNTTLATERRRLLGKAPSDDAWLNPFGPLTTKAAKAAAAAFPSNGLEQIVFLQRTNDDNISFRFEVLGKCDLRKALDHYQDLVNRRLVVDGPGLNRNNYAPPVIVDFGSEMLPIAAARQRFEAAFATNGMTLVPVGEKQFRSIKTSDLDEYRESAHLMSRKEWLAKYERPYSLLYTYSLIIALVCGTAGLPHILVRFYTNPNGVAAKRTTMWVMILIGVFYVFPPVFGVMGRNLLPGLYSGVGAKGTDKVVLELPRILNEVKGEKGEGRTESAPSPLAPRPSHFPWGSILSGITCAGAFAAFMSTFSGLLVSMTGAMAHDVYGRMLRPNSTPEQRLRAFKVCAVLIGGIAIGLGCFVEPLEINFMVGQAFAIAAASYFPLLFMSVWWRGMTMRGAASGMLIGGLCALAAVTLTNVSNLALDKGPMGKVFAGFAPLNEFWGGHPLLRILCEQPAIWTVPLAIGLMWVVSRLSARSVPRDIRMKMLVLHAPEQLGLKQEYIQEHLPGH